METNNELTTCADCGSADNLIDCTYYSLCDQCGSDHYDAMKEPN